MSGSSIGGGTFFGLARLLASGEGLSRAPPLTFEDLLRLAERGDARRCDMMVGDIYGHDYKKMGLSADVVACSFGKALASEVKAEDASRPEDRARALLMMVPPPYPRVHPLPPRDP